MLEVLRLAIPILLLRVGRSDFDNGRVIQLLFFEPRFRGSFRSTYFHELKERIVIRAGLVFPRAELRCIIYRCLPSRLLERGRPGYY